MYSTRCYLQNKGENMINNISFSGREGMLTAGLMEKAAKEVAKETAQNSRFAVSSSVLLPNIEVKAAKQPVMPSDVYTSPYAPTEVFQKVGSVLNLNA